MRDRLLRRAIRERFVVTLASGEAFDGLLDDQDSGHIVLVDAGSMVDGPGQVQQRVKIPGEVFLPRAQVKYMQRLPR